MLNDRDRVRKDWQKLMTPELLRTNLIRSSVYLTAYELLLQSLVEGPLGFFADDFTAEGEPITGAAYREHVLSLGKHKYEASARWFQGWGHSPPMTSSACWRSESTATAWRTAFPRSS